MKPDHATPCQQVNDKKKANEVFNMLVAEGDKTLNAESDDKGEFFAIFGEREAETTRKSMAYTLRGLGYNGLGEIQKAHVDLAEAVELSVSNLWASMELSALE